MYYPPAKFGDDKWFLPRNAHHRYVHCAVLLQYVVRPSVCPSVTLRYTVAIEVGL